MAHQRFRKERRDNVLAAEKKESELKEQKKQEKVRLRVEKQEALKAERLKNKEIRKITTLARKGCIIENKCFSCKKVDISDEFVTSCVICESRYHKKCIGEVSFTYVCVMCASK